MPCRIWPIFNQDLKEENRHASRIQPQSLRTTPLHSPPIKPRSIPLLFVRVGVGLTRLGSAYPLITPLAYPARRGTMHARRATHGRTCRAQQPHSARRPRHTDAIRRRSTNQSATIVELLPCDCVATTHISSRKPFHHGQRMTIHAGAMVSLRDLDTTTQRTA